MSDIGFGDILFVLLILGVIHGIMYAVSQARLRKSKKQATEAETPSA